MAPEHTRTGEWRKLLRIAGSWTAVAGVSVLLVAALAAVYVALPVPDESISAVQIVVGAAVVLFSYIVLTLWGVLRLQRSRRPIREGGILISVLAGLVVLGYAWLYLAMQAADPQSFNAPLNKAGAVYFTVTVLATVGFGDIVPVTDTARLLVSSQMLLGITLVTLGVRVIMQSARTAAQRHGAPLLGQAPVSPTPGGDTG